MGFYCAQDTLSDAFAVLSEDVREDPAKATPSTVTSRMLSSPPRF